MNYDFTSAEFLDLSPEELVAKCREYGAEAERLAATASSETRKGYIYLVMQWSLLAEDIQDGIKSSHEKPLSFSRSRGLSGAIWAVLFCGHRQQKSRTAAAHGLD